MTVKWNVKIRLKLAPDLKIYILTCGGPISSVCERALHTLLLHSTCIHVSLSGFFAAGMCYRLPCYFSLEDKRKNGKNWKRKWGSWREQTPGLLSVYTAWLSLCDMLPVSPPSVRSHDLVTDTGWWSIFYQTKLHSVTTDCRIIRATACFINQF